MAIPLQVFPDTFQPQSEEILGEKDNGAIFFPSSVLHGGLVVLLGFTVALATFLYKRVRYFFQLNEHNYYFLVVAF
jgi:hypothetical protein